MANKFSEVAEIYAICPFLIPDCETKYELQHKMIHEVAALDTVEVRMRMTLEFLIYL